jgi:hypothetical protein
VAEERNRTMLLGVAATLAVVVVVLLVLLVVRNDDEDDVTTGDTSSTTTEATTTTTAATTTTTTEATTTTTAATTTTTGGGGVTDEEAATVVWPDPGGAELFTDPVAAARGFAEDLVGFTNPVYGEFQGGDSRSGEVEVRAQADGPVTTIAVRQLSDDNWYVLAAVTEQIDVIAPTAASAIDNPLQVAGRAQAFEGTVRVAVYGRGGNTPLGEDFVTGSGGGEMGPFAGEVAWDNPGGGWGLVLFVIDSAEDGSPWQAAALPVGFIGGD